MSNTKCPSLNGKFSKQCLLLQLADLIVNLVETSPGEALNGPATSCVKSSQFRAQICEKVEELRQILKHFNEHTCALDAEEERNEENNDMSLTLEPQDPNTTQLSLEMDMTCEHAQTLKTNVRVRSILKSGQSARNGDSGRRVRFNDELSFENAIWKEITENKENSWGTKINGSDQGTLRPILENQANVNHSKKSVLGQGKNITLRDKLEKSEENLAPTRSDRNEMIKRRQKRRLKVRHQHLASTLSPRTIRVECSEIDEFVSSEQNVMKNETSELNLKVTKTPKDLEVDKMAKIII